jgi:tellurite resistance protein TerC
MENPIILATNPIAWILFSVFVLIFLAYDLGVFHKKHTEPTTKQAIIWSLVWFGLAVCFGGWICYIDSVDTGILFYTGYAMEKSLSLDNVVVFAMIFTSLKVPMAAQRKVLFWGILGALTLRCLMILLGASLIEQFKGITYVFGAIILITAVRMALPSNTNHSPTKSWFYEFLKAKLPITNKFHKNSFWVREKNTKKLKFTPLFLALIMVELSDIVFAVDSIPAIFAITKDPFIVYTSNVFAILGMRYLYFLLADAMNQFRYLKTGIAFILFLVGFKMIGVISMKPLYVLIVTLSALLISIGISQVNFNKKS